MAVKLLTAKAFSCAIEVENGIIVNAPKILAQFNGKSLDAVVNELNKKQYKFQRITVEDVDDI